MSCGLHPTTRAASKMPCAWSPRSPSPGFSCHTCTPTPCCSSCRRGQATHPPDSLRTAAGVELPTMCRPLPLRRKSPSLNVPDCVLRAGWGSRVRVVRQFGDGLQLTNKRARCRAQIIYRVTASCEPPCRNTGGRAGPLTSRRTRRRSPRPTPRLETGSSSWLRRYRLRAHVQPTARGCDG